MKLGLFLILSIYISFVFAGSFSSGPVNIYDANPVNDGDSDWENIASNVDYQPSVGKILQATVLNFDGDCSQSSCKRSDSIFTGGGSKDISDIPDWLWKTGKPQPKAEILNSAALLWENPADKHVHLYWVADRYDNSGSTFLGLWLLGDEVSPLGNGKSASPFSGAHTNNDILIVVNFGGNGNVQITIFRWINELIETFSSGAVDATCDSNNNNQIACAIQNPTDGSTSAVWPFCSKGVGCSTQGQEYKAAEFIEGALDITVVLDAEQGAPCFGTFQVETRASESPDSTLSDFTSGPFGSCAAEFETICDGAGEPISQGVWKYCFETIVTNTGVGSLYNIEVTINVPNVVSNTNLQQAFLGSDGDFTVRWCANSNGNQFQITEQTVSVTAEDASGSDFPVSFTNPGTCIGEERTISASGYVSDCTAFLSTQVNQGGDTVVVVGFNYDIVIQPVGDERDLVNVAAFTPNAPGSITGTPQWSVGSSTLTNNQVYTNSYVFYPDVTQSNPSQAEWTLGPFNAVISNNLWGDFAFQVTGQNGQQVVCKLCP